MKNKSILFSVARWNWGASKVYKDIVYYINHKYWYNIELVHPMKNWIFSHFKTYDIVFSSIPFFFKPKTSKFYSILVWNYKKEASIFTIKWLISLFFRPITFSFSDKIILMNNYLLNKVISLKKYNRKVVIIPNFIDFQSFKNFRYLKIETIKNNFSEYNKIQIFTLTWFTYYDKAKWVINLKKVLLSLANKYPNKEIVWNIAWNSNNKIFDKIIKNFDDLGKIWNLSINWLWWINKNELEKQYKINDLFLYWTELDVFPTVLLEMWAIWMPILVNNFESFKDDIPTELICKDEVEMLYKIENFSYKYIQKIWIKNSEKYDIDVVAKSFIKLIDN